MSATRRQIGKVHATLGALGITDRADKLKVLSAVIYRRIESSNDLTFDEAHIVIDTLDGLDREQLPKLIEAGERWLGSVTS